MQLPGTRVGLPSLAPRTPVRLAQHTGPARLAACRAQVGQELLEHLPGLARISNEAAEKASPAGLASNTPAIPTMQPILTSVRLCRRWTAQMRCLAHSKRDHRSYTWRCRSQPSPCWGTSSGRASPGEHGATACVSHQGHTHYWSVPPCAFICRATCCMQFALVGCHPSVTLLSAGQL